MEKEIVQLIKKAQLQDEEAFQNLYEHYYHRAYYIALRMTNNDADAQDAVQESFLQIQKSLSELKDPEKFQAWMHKIVLSKCKRIFRKNHYLSADPIQMQKYPNQIEKRSYMLPDESHKQKVDKEILLSLIDQLPLIQKEVLVLAYFEQYKYKEIAEILNITENTVKSRVLAAKKSLKRSIEAYEGRSHSKINFRSMDALLTATFITGFGVEAATTTTSLSLGAKALEFLKLHALEATVSGVLCVSGGIAIVEGYTTYMEGKALPRSAIKTEQYMFPPASYQSKTITTSEEAYFILALWANTTEQIRDKTKQECHAIEEVYNSLKQSNSPYYQHLIKTGWTNAYEESIHSNR